MTTDPKKNDEIKDEELEMVCGGTGGSSDEDLVGLGGGEGGGDGASSGGPPRIPIHPPRYEKA